MSGIQGDPLLASGGQVRVWPSHCEGSKRGRKIVEEVMGSPLDRLDMDSSRVPSRLSVLEFWISEKC